MNSDLARTARLPRVLALGAALAVGGVGATTLGPTPAANASCASFFGIGNSANCTSTLTSIAIAIGPNAQAHADGVLGAALSLGEATSASTGGFLNFAFTQGTNSSSSAGGVFSAALAALASNTNLSVGGGAPSEGNLANLGIVLRSFSDTTSNISVKGVGSLAVGVITGDDIDADGVGTVTVSAVGALNNLTNHGNFGNVSSFLSAQTSITNTAGNLAWAWDVNGLSNTVETTGAGGAVAGAFSQENETVTQNGIGVNIKVIPSTGSAKVKSGSAASVSNNNNKPSATSGGDTKKAGAKSRGRR